MWAHDFKAGALVIDHPYATPTPPGARTGAVYFRTLKNNGREADRLLGARTPAAASVEIHRSTMDGDVMRRRQIDALELPAGAEIKVRHGGELHLMLIALKAPLKEGERFPMAALRTCRRARSGGVGSAAAQRYCRAQALIDAACRAAQGPDYRHTLYNPLYLPPRPRQKPTAIASKATADIRPASTTDSDARVMKMGDGGFRPAINVQFATTCSEQVIVGMDVVNAGSDMAQLVLMVEQVERRLG